MFTGAVQPRQWRDFFPAHAFWTASLVSRSARPTNRAAHGITAFVLKYRVCNPTARSNLSTSIYSAANEMLCGNICPYIKAVVDQKINGQLEDFKGMVFVNSCDGMRRLYDAWVKLDQGKKTFNYILDIPKNTDDSAVFYYANLLKNFKETNWKHFSRSRLTRMTLTRVLPYTIP